MTEARSGLPQGGDNAQMSERTKEHKHSQALVTLCSVMRWLLLCAFFALIPAVAALSCEIDLSVFGADESNQGIVAQCDAGCDSCNFSLANGTFEYGIVKCLPSVPCFLQINTGADLDYTTVNGSQASALIVETNNASYPLGYAVIHAPANRGYFRFEARNTAAPLSQTTFRAVNTGVVDIVIDSDGVNSPDNPELRSVFVYASTADELNIWLGADTRYSKFGDSVIQCPNNGKCELQSNAKRYNVDGYAMSFINLFCFPGTDLRLLCEDSNSEACDGIAVHCGEFPDTCDMQYDIEWQCVGTLNSAAQCFANVNPTTTATPTSTTTTTKKPTADTSTVLPDISTSQTPIIFFLPTTTLPLARTTPQHSDSGGNGWKLTHVLIVAIGTVACLGLCGCLCVCYKYKVANGSEEASEPSAEFSLDADGSIHLEESYSGPKQTKGPNVVFIEIGEPKPKSKQSKLAKFSAKTEKQLAVEMLVMDETRGADNGQLADGSAADGAQTEDLPTVELAAVRSHTDSLIEDQPEGVHATDTGTAARGHGANTGFVGDAVADEDLEDEMLYFAGSDWPTDK